LTAFDEIRRIVMNDSALMESLTSAETDAALHAQVISLAQAHNLQLTVAELLEVARANRKSWLERSLP
jgi:hypothetical protein